MRTRLWLVTAMAVTICACTDDVTHEEGAGYSAQTARSSGAALAEAVANAFVKACPIGALDDAEERDACADALSADALLKKSFRQPYLRWGGQAANAGLDLDSSNTTKLDPLVWLRLYLSTFAFTGEQRVEQDGERHVARLQVVFRYALDAGEYPYPFWHSQAKWQSYERTQELLLLVKGETVEAVLRSAEQDPERPHVEREWDGRWQWNSERGEEPRVALYGFLFSRGNPHVETLEAVFRRFSDKQREAACTDCHNPGNPSKINPLEFFNYPNQALTGRHDIVTQLKENLMPPANTGTAAGIGDEGYRKELVALADEFAEIGDKALEYEAKQ